MEVKTDKSEKKRLQRIRGATGRSMTVPSGSRFFYRWGSGKDVVLLGLGPDVEAIKGMVTGARNVFFVESPQFAEQMPISWKSGIPPRWVPLKSRALTPRHLRRSQILVYSPNLKLFPEFWAPVWAKCRLWQLPPVNYTAENQPVWMVSDPKDLLVHELSKSFKASGVKVREMSATGLIKRLCQQLSVEKARCLISINFNGLDPYGECYRLLENAGIPVYVWCVDNPFHLISRLKTDDWKRMILRVTDKWFVRQLRNLGVADIDYLPLGVCPDFFQNSSVEKDASLQDRMVFVGRSEFPGNRAFFAGVELPRNLLFEARERVAQGGRTDFSWWNARLDGEMKKMARESGYGAAYSNRLWRIRCLEVVSRTFPLTVFGGGAWGRLLQNVSDIRGTVDYYSGLCSIYRDAAYSLNLTSMLLPCALNQRHFDVWAAGGFLITDRTEGLCLFPDRLVREIAFHKPEEINGIMTRLDKQPGLRQNLKAEWQQLILSQHTYTKRIETILNEIEIKRRRSSNDSQYGNQRTQHPISGRC